MNNKSKLKSIINEDFNKKNNYNQIINRIERNSMKKFNFKYTISICMLIIICTLGIYYKKDSNNPNLITNININKISNSIIALDSDVQINGVFVPFDESFKSIYELKLPKDFGSTWSELNSIYVRENKNINSYDKLNNYIAIYYGENNRKLVISFSKDNTPIRDYYFEIKDEKISKINNIDVKLFNYENFYYSIFKYNNINFDIETDNLEEEEFINVLTSIIK